MHLESRNNKELTRPVRPFGVTKKGLGFVRADISLGQKNSGVEWGATFLHPLLLQLMRSQNPASLLQDGSGLKQNSQNGASSRTFAFAQPYLDLYHRSMVASQSTEFQFFLGGDHSVSMSTIAAKLKFNPNLKVLWIDAHGDINTPLTSPTGNLHGMPVAALLGLFETSVAKFLDGGPFLKPENIFYLGVRDLDLGEKKVLHRLQIPFLTAQEVEEIGMDKSFDLAMRSLRPSDLSPLHVSFDIDSVDPRYAPATGVPVQGGLNHFDLQRLGERLGSQAHFQSMDLVELDPFLTGSMAELNQTLGCFRSLLEPLFEGPVFNKILKASEDSFDVSTFQEEYLRQHSRTHYAQPC